MKRRHIALIIVSFLFVLSSCVFEIDSSNNKTEQNTKEYTAAYICPMHCEGSGSTQEGVCPVCGMDYVKNEQEHQY